MKKGQQSLCLGFISTWKLPNPFLIKGDKIKNKIKSGCGAWKLPNPFLISTWKFHL